MDFMNYFKRDKNMPSNKGTTSGSEGESSQPQRNSTTRNRNLNREKPDMNGYQQKKTLAAGMMDVSLFSANANQLRTVLDAYGRHRYYYIVLICIYISLLIQIAIGILLLWNAKYNVGRDRDIYRANRVNNYTVIGVFLVTAVNVFISVFEVSDPNPLCTNLVAIGSNST